MQSILYISCSPRGAESHSLRFAEEVLTRLRQLHPNAVTHNRDLIANPPALVDAAFSAAVLDPTAGAGPFRQSEMLLQELEAADVVVIATPMHNFTVPAVLKAGIDQVVRIRRSFASTPEGKVGLLRDRPVYIVIASGGWFSGPSPTGTPAQPDFLTPYLRTILSTIGISDVHVLTLEGVTRGPAMLERALFGAREALDLALGHSDEAHAKRR
jgi:FMN-dependent NADH-azoreductase